MPLICNPFAHYNIMLTTPFNPKYSLSFWPFAHFIGFGWRYAAFFSLLLFVVTKSNQKRLDKKNLLRLWLREKSFLSQRNDWLTLRAPDQKNSKLGEVNKSGIRWH